MSNQQLTKIGWCLFVVSAVLFAISAFRARDWLALSGAGAFFFANLCFILALSRES